MPIQLGDTSVPSVQSISVFDKFAATTFTATAASSGNWLSAGAGGITPGSGCGFGGCQQVGRGNRYGARDDASSATNQSLVVPVTIAVANAASAVLSVSPATEKCLSLAQGSAGASGQVTVTNSGGGTLLFATAQAASDQWMARYAERSRFGYAVGARIIGVHGQSFRTKSWIV